MQHTKARIVALLAFGAALHVAQSAEARLPPDILLLVDSSGSMAYSSVRDTANPSRYALPKCAAWPASTTVDFAATAFSATATPPDRWAMVVKVLTGKINGVACSAESRSTADFKNEFALGGTSYGGGQPPSDAGYYLPYNRIIATSGGVSCTPAPSWDADIRQQLLDNATMWPTTSSTGPILWRTTGNYATSVPCPFDPQEPDGIIDAYRELVRFGFMTFDPSPNWTDGTTIKAGTGLMSGGVEAYYPSGIGDTWSYFPGWMTDTTFGSAATGWPGGCDSASGQTSKLLEVGIRNPAAPPWEGRLMGFGDELAEASTIATNNERVQAALSAMRPYGGTPVAGMLEDARYFLLEDTTILKDSAQKPYFWGGATDTAVSTDPTSDACRKRYIVLLTDGGPNLDLRPECSLTINNTAGKCPYPLPTDTAEILKNNNIPVYVIGFAVSASGGSTQTCTQLFTANPNACNALTSCTSSGCASGKCAYGYCVDTTNSTDELLATCCTIKGIADKGGGKAYFAEDSTGLDTAFSQILKDVVQPTDAPSQPVFSTVSAQVTGSATDSAFQGAQYLSASHQSVDTGDGKTVVGQLPIGDLDRQRIACEFKAPNGPWEPIDQSVDATLGDKFQINIDAHKATRRIYTVVGQVTNGHIYSGRSIRPLISDPPDDHLGAYKISDSNADGTNTVSALAPGFPARVDARAVVDSSDCNAGVCCYALASGSQANCRTWFLNLELGDKAGPTEVTFQRASAFGAVERTPLLVSTPALFLRDDSYATFQKLFSRRPTVLYATTSDGQLHAFNVTPPAGGPQALSTDLNELWSFIPPAMLGPLTDQFKNRKTASARSLMNGVLVSRDVAGATAIPTNGRFLTRTRAQAKGATDTRWYTVLLGSFGNIPGFFAIDVSWPDPDDSKSLPMSGYVRGPRFLWQLTTDDAGNPLFGDRGARPSIATLYFKMPGDSAPAEHAVAILPGGWGGQASETEFETAQFADQGVLDTRFTARGTTRKYTAGASPTDQLKLAGARSVTVVRLDTGEVVRTFRSGDPAATPALADAQAPAGLYATTPNRIVNAGFDAPIVGEVVTYPGTAGAVADRAYFGDAEGRLWRLDLSAKDPADWDAAMILDAYPTSGFNNDYTESEASPIETPPVISADTLGRVTVAVSTGSQLNITAAGKYPVWSLTETPGTKPITKVNWFLNEHNTSAQIANDTAAHFANGERVMGPMSLFNGNLYFTTQRPRAQGIFTCDSGDAFVWGVHYVNSGSPAGVADPTNPFAGPMPELRETPQTDPNVLPVPSTDPLVRLRKLDAGTVAYGVGVRQRPSCFTTAPDTSDPFLGYGSHSSITSANPGTFQLVIQSGGAGVSSGDSSVKTTTETLAPPAGGVTIDSWAAILE